MLRALYYRIWGAEGPSYFFFFNCGKTNNFLQPSKVIDLAPFDVRNQFCVWMVGVLQALALHTLGGAEGPPFSYPTGGAEGPPFTF